MSALAALTECEFLFTEEQASRVGVSRREIRRSLQTRSLARYLVSRARRLELNAPVYQSQDGKPLAAGALEGRLRRRFEGARVQVSLAYSARQSIDPAKYEHELHVTEVFLWCHQHRADLLWLPESVLRAQCGAQREDGVIPDGALVHPQTGEIVTLIDYVSAYRSPRLKALLGFATERGLAIEFW